MGGPVRRRLALASPRPGCPCGFESPSPQQRASSWGTFLPRSGSSCVAAAGLFSCDLEAIRCRSYRGPKLRFENLPWSRGEERGSSLLLEVSGEGDCCHEQQHVNGAPEGEPRDVGADPGKKENRRHHLQPLCESRRAAPPVGSRAHHSYEALPDAAEPNPSTPTRAGEASPAAWNQCKKPACRGLTPTLKVLPRVHWSYPLCGAAEQRLPRQGSRPGLPISVEFSAPSRSTALARPL